MEKKFCEVTSTTPSHNNFPKMSASMNRRKNIKAVIKCVCARIDVANVLPIVYGKAARGINRSKICVS